MASWDDEDFDPDNIAVPQAKSTDKWEGEDEDDDDVKDNWEDEDNEKQEDAKPVEVKKKKKPLTERIKEKEEKKRQEKLKKEEELRKQQETEENATPADELEEKRRRQKLVEEADFELLKDAFGAQQNQVVPGEKTIDGFHPTNKEEFLEFSKMLVTKITKFESKPDYVMFLENLFRDCCTGVEAEDIKRISNTLNVLASEKLKLMKGAKTKKKTAKKALVGASMKLSKKDEFEDYTEDYNEFDDFM